jgi:hypothetical protein
MHSVLSRNGQDVNRIGQLHGLRVRDVFYNSRGLDMHCLSVKLLLVCRKLSFDELHLQRWLFWD